MLTVAHTIRLSFQTRVLLSALLERGRVAGDAVGRIERTWRRPHRHMYRLTQDGRGLVRQPKTRPCVHIQRVRSTTRPVYMPRFFFTPIRTEAQSWLMRAMNALPKEEREWGRAVISELDGISGFWPCLNWDRRRDDGDVESNSRQHVDGCLAQTTWPKTALRNCSGESRELRNPSVTRDPTAV